MWFKFALEDNNLIYQQFIDRLNVLEKINSIEDRNNQARQLYGDIIEQKAKIDPEEINKYEDLIQKLYDIIEYNKEETEIDFRDLYSVQEWLIKQDQLSDVDISVLLNVLDEDFPRWYVKKTYDGQRVRMTDDEMKLYQWIKETLVNRAFHEVNVNKEKLNNPERWSAYGSDIYSDPKLGFIKAIDWLPSDDADEGTYVQFFIDKDGIVIISEVAVPISVSQQKQLLNEFMEDVQQFPNDWNKKFKYIDGGDFKDIIEGRLSEDITVYRMMSPNEYEKWVDGETIPVGKFFTTDRRYAQGTDFGTEGYRDVFKFRVNRESMSGESENVLVSSVPLILNNGKLERKV